MFDDNLVLSDQEANFENLLSYITESHLPTLEEHLELRERVLDVWMYPELLNECEVYDLLYWSQIYYGKICSRIFYEILYWMRIDSSNKRIDELLDYAPTVIDSCMKDRLDKYKLRNRRCRHLIQDEKPIEKSNYFRQKAIRKLIQQRTIAKWKREVGSRK